ncbi:ubiquitin-protein ligase E3B-like [Schistocerca gregaria]|uniref:ubiquitin-protein ligase E3B-like n=1 Tax=Schistocerca gregaria TaxID=7010 RepID=UPI00211E4F7A|nr:ubiquitin-protein ligase E3B-like [Schistocerca gregaria]
MFFTGKKICLKNSNSSTASAIINHSRKSREEREKQRKRLFLIKLVQYHWRISLSIINYRKAVYSNWVFFRLAAESSSSQNENLSAISTSNYVNECYMKILREFLFFTKKIDDSCTILKDLIPVLSSPKYLELSLHDENREQWILQVSDFSGLILSSLAYIYDVAFLDQLLEFVFKLTNPEYFHVDNVQISDAITKSAKKIGLRLVRKHNGLKLLSSMSWQQDCETYLRIHYLRFMICFRIYIYFQLGADMHKDSAILADQNRFMFNLLSSQHVDHLCSREFPGFASSAFECILMLLKIARFNPTWSILSANGDSYKQVSNFLIYAIKFYQKSGQDLKAGKRFTKELSYYVEAFHQFSDEYIKEVDARIDLEDETWSYHQATERFADIKSTLGALKSSVKAFLQLRVEEVGRMPDSEGLELHLCSEISSIAKLFFVIQTHSKLSHIMNDLAEPVICLWPHIQQKFVDVPLSATDSRALVLAFFCLCCEHVLSSVPYQEMDVLSLYQSQKHPMMKKLVDLTQFRNIVLFLKGILVFRVEHHPSMPIPNSFVEFMKAFNRLIRILKKRNHAMKSVLPDSVFTIEEIDSKNLIDESEPQAIMSLHVPFVIPFLKRVALFHKLIEQDKHMSYNGLYDEYSVRVICIQRGNGLLTDAFNKLNPLQGQLKGPIKIEFMSEQGVAEPGIDGGGLLREFLSEVTKLAFSPDYGLFLSTPENQLYPNPKSAIYVEDHIRKFTFLGRLIGKCIYEMILLELPLAPFFLSYLLGYPTGIEDLRSLDCELYRGVRKMLDDPNVSDLGLYFVASTALGGVQELVSDGSNVSVTPENRNYFAKRLTKYKLVSSIRDQSDAFLEGLADIIKLEWLQLFSEEELMIVLCGGGRLDVQDLKAYATFGNGFHANHHTIRMLWEVLEEFSDEQQELFLKFTTSVSRPPVLGFATLNPPFCIRKSENTTDFLPTANTCFNMLKLPPYNSKRQLREKLLYAITSGARFELS